MIEIAVKRLQIQEQRANGRLNAAQTLTVLWINI